MDPVRANQDNLIKLLIKFFMYFGTLNVNLQLSVTLNKFTLPPHVVWSINKQFNALLGLLFKGTGQ